MQPATLAELAFIAISYGLFNLVLIGTVMAMSIFRRLRLERLEGRYVPVIAQPLRPRRNDEESTVLFENNQRRATGVTRVVLHPRQNTSV